MKEEYRPGKVLCIVVTDGHENASREYTRKQVFDMVTHQREKYNWEFIYLGANQDAFAEGRSMGFSQSINYVADAIGAQGVTRGISNGVASYRSGGGYVHSVDQQPIVITDSTVVKIN